MVDWKKRIITGVIAVPILLGACLFKTSLLIVVIAASVFSLQEYTHIISEILKKQTSSKYYFYVDKLSSLQFIHLPILFFLQAVYFSQSQSDLELYQFLTIMMISLCGLIKFLQAKPKEKDVDEKTLLWLTFGYITGYVFYFLIFVQPLSFIIYAYNYEKGYSFIILHIITAFQSDNGALFMGSALGKRLFCPRISPKKTIEGVFGAVLLSVLTNILIYFFNVHVAPVMPDISLSQYIIIGFLGSIAAVYGDLLESFVKRAADTKDSGSIFPGHGGILDRLDSLMYSAPIVFMYIKMFILNDKTLV
ncbi:phosphatidate cytidylyltransferase (macronuclear) [Tetrahymena thermophila SB210]|uniref:Phosphatidate cytidylyltransferase n=1 Tax=Tetrahymena thermophila (strain SB210) TaxID=312017 RepID=I7LWQ9_TETTS|nr:phosphatidate cytidylyltransferase [Tetrahymena thermophila SB210]EAS02679.2 phosphatidate cytidylyltransferase [Tetrahymena thermophila SB210]|eukprot:XP_001022924.2 phosphatidate cytidylyltransferase [Tetrahymena thermophila SB210]